MNLQNQVLNLAGSSAVQVARRVLGRCVKSQRQFRARVEQKAGLEIGGPSHTFQDGGILPLYRHIKTLDNCVFSQETLWEGKRVEGLTFSFQPRKANGFNFIREATDLHGIPDRRYDFVLSSHSLEHTANPIRALREWMRVVTPGGAVIVILPDYRHTFDHRRSPTLLEHMLDDYHNGRDERDLTHFDEILDRHDLARDPAAGSLNQFRQRSLQNFENRCMHHHVFDECNSRRLLEAAGLTVEILELVKPFHIVILGQRPATQA